jgi:hypothetical protein
MKISKKIKESAGRCINKEKKRMERPMVIRVTKEEFELSDGRIFPMMFDFAEDEVPSVEDFQKQYDQWLALFSKLKLTGANEQAVSEHK